MEEKPFYEQWWFWVCITVIMLCLTKSHNILMFGNGAGNSNNGSSNATTKS